MGCGHDANTQKPVATLALFLSRGMARNRVFMKQGSAISCEDKRTNKCMGASLVLKSTNSVPCHSMNTFNSLCFPPNIWKLGTISITTSFI